MRPLPTMIHMIIKTRTCLIPQISLKTFNTRQRRVRMVVPQTRPSAKWEKKPWWMISSPWDALLVQTIERIDKVSIEIPSDTTSIRHHFIIMIEDKTSTLQSLASVSVSIIIKTTRIIIIINIRRVIPSKEGSTSMSRIWTSQIRTEETPWVADTTDSLNIRI